jgi:hypothetical protein
VIHLKKIKKLLIAGLAALALGAVTVTALAAGDYGSAAVEQGTAYSIPEMLTYALQDETLAYVGYAKINETLGNIRPFANIVKAEKTHIAALERLFAAYGVALPDNTAAGYVTAPADQTAALNAGIQAEKSNVAMYEKFLAQTLPDDVKAVFTALKTASGQHLAAFERRLTGGTGIPSGNGSGAMNRGAGAGCGMSRGQNRGSGSCSGLCLAQEPAL